MIEQNIAAIRKKMDEAALACGRDPKEILLCAATKMNDAEKVKRAVLGGVDKEETVIGIDHSRAVCIEMYVRAAAKSPQILCRDAAVLCRDPQMRHMMFLGVRIDGAAALGFNGYEGNIGAIVVFDLFKIRCEIMTRFPAFDIHFAVFIRIQSRYDIEQS